VTAWDWQTKWTALSRRRKEGLLSEHPLDGAHTYYFAFFDETPLALETSPALSHTLEIARKKPI
jgi:hypothetical protein